MHSGGAIFLIFSLLFSSFLLFHSYWVSGGVKSILIWVFIYILGDGVFVISIEESFSFFPSVEFGKVFVYT